MAETQSQDGDGDWGWEPLDEEPDHPHPPRGQESPRPTHEAKTSPLSKSNSEKSFPGRKGSNSSLAMKGIVSSPSFAELEMAIGNTLNNSDSSEFNAPSKPFPRSKHSGTDLTQQKLHQQRLRQQQRGYSHGHHSRAHGHGGSPVHNPQPPAREVLEPFTNETEAHAIVLFHSPHASPESIQDACCKHGGLYYLRPEFHLKGVTLLSYLDLRCAASAKACLGGELGTAADASAHFSVMLHAASSPLDETRLKVSGLPGSCSIEEVHSIFTRYGQLRSLVKTTLEGQQPAARTAAMAEGGETSDSGEAGADVGEEAGQAYAVDLEYFNINDARLAASELSAASAQLWDTEVSIEFAPLDERKQHLCRQLLATLSRWRSEMANAAYSSMGGNYGMQGMQGMQHAGMQGMYGMQGMQGMYGMQGMQGMPGMHGQGGWGGMQMGVPIGMGGMQHGMSRSMMGGMPMPLPMLMESPHQLGSQYYEQGRQQEQHEQHQYQQHQQHQQQQEQQEQQQGQQQQESVAVDGIAAAPSRRAEVETLGGAGAGAAAGDGQDSGGYGEDNETAYGTNSSSYSQQRPVGYEGPRDQQMMQQMQMQQQMQLLVQMQQMQMMPPGTMPDARTGGRYAGGQGAGGRGRGGRGRDAAPQHHNGGHSPHPSQQPMQQQQQQQQPQQAQQGRRTGKHTQQQGQYTAGWNGGVAGNHQIESDFALDLGRIGEELESRTTIMVRNIPNKYTQAMLLEEVNAQHEGSYDFFYLPIDFKNRCNVGYCFINFLDAKSIPPFVHEFNGQRWKSFNSEKVCAVSFARIQGKQAMIQRFQNSSLLEKDDTYQPLLFYTSGPDRGKPEPFPLSSNSRSRQQTQRQQNQGDMQHSHTKQQKQHQHQQQQYSREGQTEGTYADSEES